MKPFNMSGILPMFYYGYDELHPLFWQRVVSFLYPVQHIIFLMIKRVSRKWS